MARYFLHTIGEDRPGIVARLARSLADLGCNLEDSRMTLMRGQFAVMLVLDAPAGMPASQIESQLAGVADELDLVVAVRPLDDVELERRHELPAGGPGGTTVAVSVHGADHPGIVARIAEELAALGANVVDLATHVVGGPSPTYVMVLDVVLADADGYGQLAARLAAAAGDLGVRCVATAGDADLL